MTTKLWLLWQVGRALLSGRCFLVCVLDRSGTKMSFGYATCLTDARSVLDDIGQKLTRSGW